MTIYHGEKLIHVDRQLSSLITRVAQYRDCVVLEGDRTVDAERTNIAAGTSHLTNPMDCLHVIDPVLRPFALAVDVAPYPLDWNNKDRFVIFAGSLLLEAEEMGLQIRWGGDWSRMTRSCGRNKPGVLDDLDHFERVT